MADAPRRSRRRRRRVLLVAFLVLAGWCTRFAWLRMTRHPTPRPEYWKARLAELDPPPPGAISAQEAASILANCPWKSIPRPLGNSLVLAEAVRNQRNPDFVAVAGLFGSDAFIKARAAVRAATTAGWRFNIELADSGTTLAACRSWAEALTAHSCWARTHTNDSRAAIDDWLIVLRMARQMWRSQTPNACRAATSMVHMAAQEMILASRESLAPVDTGALAIEAESIQCFLETVYVREGGDWLAVSDLVKYRAPRAFGAPLAPSRLWNLTSPLFDDLAATRAAVEQHWSMAASCTDLQACVQASNRTEDALEQLTAVRVWEGWGCDCVSAVSPWRNRSMLPRIAGYYQTRCRLDAGLAMLAIAEYHRRNGRYPGTLDDLLPEFLPRLPIDYANRQALRYRRTAEGYLLYSIGVNGKDDGGTAAADRPTRFDERNLDVVFSAVQRKKANE
jgi:hypothetical protein